jgi:uncharacterized membrane protein
MRSKKINIRWWKKRLITYFYRILINHLTEMGKAGRLIKETGYTVCHCRADRSFFIKGRQFPLCARCTGILAGNITMPFFLFDVFYLNIWWALALIVPAYIDGWSQLYFRRSSNNTLRFFTGLLMGIGLTALAADTGMFIVSLF